MNDIKQAAAMAANTTEFSEEWRSYVEPLAPVGGRLADLLSDPRDPQLRQEMYAHLYSVLSQSFFGLMYADPEHPAFWPLLNAAFNTLGPNPDDVYTMSPIDGNGVYKLSGFRGTVRILSFSIGSGTFFTKGTGGFGPSLSDYNVDDLHIADNGWFEVILSPTRPRDHKGDWWELNTKSTNILMRQRSYDWMNEVDGRVAIERLDRPTMKPRATAAQIESKLRDIAGWAERNTKWSITNLNGFRKDGWINKVFLHDYANGGLTTQKYVDGLFDLQPDEALYLETDIPKKCLYWNFQLTDELYAAIDYAGRQTSLNGHSARLDSDGKFRAIISAQDPGVPNWLDTGGYQRGDILGRWQEFSDAPLPAVTKIKVADARKYLPADTPVITPGQREAALRQRRNAFQMRHKW